MSVRVRHVVELRPPRLGERFLNIDEGRTDTAEFDFHNSCWVIVDPEPADPAEAQS